MTKSTKSASKGIYLLPNLFTTGGLFAGYYSIIASINGKYEIAAITVFIAALLDGLDGRVARLTNTQSAFGEQYDSLADLISFGLAPSLLMYNWSLYSLGQIHPIMGKIGWLVAFIYAVSGALRLARFNVHIGSVDKNFFEGLPSPAAAALLCSFVWVAVDHEYTGVSLQYVVLAITLIAGLLMVSKFRYYSFKTLPFKESVPFVWILILVLIFVMLTLAPAKVLLIVFSAYAISGILLNIYMFKNKKNRKLKLKKTLKEKGVKENDLNKEDSKEGESDEGVLNKDESKENKPKEDSQ